MLTSLIDDAWLIDVRECRYGIKIQVDEVI